MRWVRSRTAMVLLCVVLGIAAWEFGSGAYIYAKAQVGQWLIAQAWESSLKTHQPVKPWAWADTFPIGRLVVKELGVDQYVLSGASGRTLAFGPGHYTGTVDPGDKGRAVIAGHRDTHFLFQRAISLGKVKTTKTTKDREVDLADDLLPLLENFILFVKAEAAAQDWPGPYWLFPNAKGTPAQESDERQNRKLFARVLSSAALPDDFTPYDLRHTFASLLLSSGAPLLYVSQQMGHAKPTTTLKHYSKWMPKGEQRFVNDLAGALEKNGWHQKLAPS